MLNFDSPSKAPRSPKPLKLILSIGALAGVIALGSTLAANIGINTGAPIEFGQGVAQTTACDSNVILTPISTFENEEGAGEFKYTGITLSDLDTTDQSGSSEGCAGMVFTIKAYDEAGAPLSSFGYSISVGDSELVSPAGVIGSLTRFGYSDTSATLTFNPFFFAAKDIYRITIESAVAEEIVPPIVYTVGETGPGGGNVFYVSLAGFNCGRRFTSTGSPMGGLCHYLEAAPADWSDPGIATQDLAMEWAVAANYSRDVDGGVDLIDFPVANDDPINNSSAAIGLGYRNSITIVNQGNDASTAAGAARAYSGGAKSDWYLPTSAELNQMCKWARAVDWTSDSTLCSGGTLNMGTGAGLNAAGFVAHYYWSSSERVAEDVWAQGFVSNGLQTVHMKFNPTFVRPIRAF
jgi:hypothetical protein